MLRRRLARRLIGALLVAAPVVALAQFTSPNTINIAGDVAATLGGTVFVNHGLVGVGRLSASQIDPFGESFGSVSGLQITGWAKNGGSYTGAINILPDRGYNSGSFFADYHTRINRVTFTFTPYYGAANIGGVTVTEKIALQNQIAFGIIDGTKLTYQDPNHGLTFTTGLDPGTGSASLFGATLPYVFDYTGAATPDATSNTLYPNIRKLAIDAEALALKADGSGYFGDEYAGAVYYFDSNKQIVGVIVPPAAMQPHLPFGVPFYGGAPNPDNGRRPNQGTEGVALSPDGTRLFALLQSATMQDSGSANQTRRNTRLLVYDVTSSPTPTTPIAEYALTLPTLRGNGNGGGASTLNNTAQQSEIVALDNSRLLVLPRDGNGLGTTNNNQSVYKTVILVDLTVGGATNFAGDAAKNAEGGAIATVSTVSGVTSSNLNAGITPLSWSEAINILNTAQLGKFNVALDTGGTVTRLTLGEKWEGFALVPALDPAAPDDYFLFVGNDNDFLVGNPADLTKGGKMRGPAGTIIDYNGFAPHIAAGVPGRIPPVAGSTNWESDTVILAYRVTIARTPTVERGGFTYDRRTQKFTQQVTVRNTTQSAFTGPIYLALDGLSSNATLANGGGVTAKNAPLGSPFIQVLASGVPLPPGGSVSVALQFTNLPSMPAITYTPRVLVLTGPVTP